MEKCVVENRIISENQVQEMLDENSATIIEIVSLLKKKKKESERVYLDIPEEDVAQAEKEGCKLCPTQGWYVEKTSEHVSVLKEKYPRKTGESQSNSIDDARMKIEASLQHLKQKLTQLGQMADGTFPVIANDSKEYQALFGD